MHVDIAAMKVLLLIVLLHWPVQHVVSKAVDWNTDHFLELPSPWDKFKFHIWFKIEPPTNGK